MSHYSFINPAFTDQGCLELADPVLILFQATDVVEV